jgi:hypothetical protein
LAIASHPKVIAPSRSTRVVIGVVAVTATSLRRTVSASAASCVDVPVADVDGEDNPNVSAGAKKESACGVAVVAVTSHTDI